MGYPRDVVEFARRTRCNLDYICNQKKTGADVYEVTALINSMLGLLVYPNEKFFRMIPNTSLDELRKKGWPLPRDIEVSKEAKGLQKLVEYIRNAMTHNNIEYLTSNGDDGGIEISGVKLWSSEQRGKAIVWSAKFNIDELDEFVRKFVMEIVGK